MIIAGDQANSYELLNAQMHGVLVLLFCTWLGCGFGWLGTWMQVQGCDQCGCGCQRCCSSIGDNKSAEIIICRIPAVGKVQK